MSRLFDALESIEKRQNGRPGNWTTPFASEKGTPKGGKGQFFLLLAAGLLLLVTATAGGVIYFNVDKTEVADLPPQPRLPDRDIGRTSIPAVAHSGKAKHLTSQAITHTSPGPASANAAGKSGLKVVKLAESTHRRRNRAMAITQDQAKSPGPVKKRAAIFSPDIKRMLQQAEELRDSGKIGDAERIYEKLWQRTRNPLIANNLAACLIISGELRKARRILEKALKLNPDDPDLHYNLKILEEKIM